MPWRAIWSSKRKRGELLKLPWFQHSAWEPMQCHGEGLKCVIRPFQVEE